MTFEDVMERLPWIAIVRGVRPEEAVEIATALADGGILAVEVPLNSPEPLASIRLMRNAVGDRLLVGAGTVLTADQVNHVLEAGAAFVVSPNADERVIGETRRRGMTSLPGVFTPTEAFMALEARSQRLEDLPRRSLQSRGDEGDACRPAEGTRIMPVGGVGVENFRPWVEAGAAGFGVGGASTSPAIRRRRCGSARRR